MGLHSDHLQAQLYPVSRSRTFGPPLFLTRQRRRLSRFLVYQRVHTAAKLAHIHGDVSPHRLRHTFATHLVRAGVEEDPPAPRLKDRNDADDAGRGTRPGRR
ncbi:MAG: tyrosine-type recombinase/integrase [Dehalococcoidia bacterium]